MQPNLLSDITGHIHQSTARGDLTSDMLQPDFEIILRLKLVSITTGVPLEAGVIYDILI